MQALSIQFVRRTEGFCGQGLGPAKSRYNSNITWPDMLNLAEKCNSCPMKVGGQRKAIGFKRKDMKVCGETIRGRAGGEKSSLGAGSSPSPHTLHRKLWTLSGLNST